MIDPPAADASDALDLDLAAHGIAEGLAGRLIAAHWPSLQIDVDHVGLVGEVVQVHPLEHARLRSSPPAFSMITRMLSKHWSVCASSPINRLGRRQIPGHDHRGEDVVAHARPRSGADRGGQGPQPRCTSVAGSPRRTPGARLPRRLAADRLSSCAQGRFALSGNNSSQPGIDVRPILLASRKLVTSPMLSRRESRALDQRGEVAPRVRELPLGIRRQLAGGRVDPANRRR